jgi:hypothetical protein
VEPAAEGARRRRVLSARARNEGRSRACAAARGRAVCVWCATHAWRDLRRALVARGGSHDGVGTSARAAPAFFRTTPPLVPARLSPPCCCFLARATRPHTQTMECAKCTRAGVKPTPPATQLLTFTAGAELICERRGCSGCVSLPPLALCSLACRHLGWETLSKTTNSKGTTVRAHACGAPARGRQPALCPTHTRPLAHVPHARALPRRCCWRSRTSAPSAPTPSWEKRRRR